MVAYIDLDDFKAINDTMGHATGDGLLRHVAGVLQEQFPDATVARFGGDEFGVLLPGLTVADDCASIARALHEAISKRRADRRSSGHCVCQHGHRDWPR